jgi:hypothetical protein
MKKALWLIPIALILIIVGLLVWQFLLKDNVLADEEPYYEPFDGAGTWMVGEDADASGLVQDGSYEITINSISDTFWVTAGKDFSDGVFEVEATPLEGALDNGYGMIFRVDEDDGDFYLFKISSDGYGYIGRCRNFCQETLVFVSNDWFPSPNIIEGFGVTNSLRVSAAGPEMTFYVNDVEVGQITDDELKRGDIGLIAETFAPGGVRVAFDNFSVTPIEDD